MIITAGKTSVSIYVYFVDDDGGTAPGEPTTGLLFSDIDTGGSASYVRQGAARVDLTLITLASASAAHADGGFILVDDTNMPGLYRVDFPNAAFATGVDQVFIHLVAASGKNTVMRPVAIDITDVDLRDAVRAGMTALPNAAADAAGGLTISDLGGLDLDAMNTNMNDIETDTNELQGDDVPGLIATLDAVVDTVKAETALIVADTNELQGDDVPGLIAALDAVVDTVKAETALIVADTNELQVDDVPGLIAALNDISTANVLTQVNTALDTAITELAVAVPSVTPSLRTAAMLMYMALRNKLKVQTSGVDALEVHNDAGTLITKKLITDDGTDLTEAKMS